MFKRVRRCSIIFAAILILALGGCDTYRKAGYAPDAAFVKKTWSALLFVA